MYDISVEVESMIRDEVVKLVQDCIAIMKEQKDYDFELLCIDDGEKYEKEDNKLVFHITLSWSSNEDPSQHPFELIKIVPEDTMTEEDRIEKGKGIIRELNKAANDFKEGKEYEPTYMQKLRDMFKLMDYFGGNGNWYM